MKIQNLDMIRQRACLTKTKMAETLGMSRVTYYKALETGELDDDIVYAHPELFGMEKPEDYNKYTSESLRASINFYRLGYGDFQKLWGEEFTFSTMWSLAKGHKNLYYLKDLFDATFHPVIVPCEFVDGEFVPVKQPRYQSKKERTKEETVE